MKIILILSLVLFSCNKESEYSLPITVEVNNTDYSQEDFNSIKSYVDDVNKRLGCEAVRFTVKDSTWKIKWATYAEMQNHFDYIKAHGGISTIDYSSNDAVIYFAIDCNKTYCPKPEDIGLTFLHWIWYIQTGNEQCTDHSSISWCHPNFFLTDPVGSLVEELNKLGYNKKNLCYY